MGQSHTAHRDLVDDQSGWCEGASAVPEDEWDQVAAHLGSSESTLQDLQGALNQSIPFEFSCCCSPARLTCVSVVFLSVITSAHISVLLQPQAVFVSGWSPPIEFSLLLRGHTRQHSLQTQPWRA